QPEYRSYKLVWHGIPLEVRHCSNWLPASSSLVTQHIEVRAEPCVPLPITATGYRSHFMNGSEALSAFNHDPVQFVTEWLDEASRSPGWSAQRQLSLF
ncbi:MAG: hypothetical protein ACPG7W_00050, partial [Paracoccaceae bacterium]